MTTGQRVAQKRKELGLSQEALGEKLSVSRQSIYKWESDSALPEVEKLVAIAAAALCLCGVLAGFYMRLKDLTQSYAHLQGSIVQVQTDVNVQIDGISQRVEELLRSQNAVTADYSAELVSADPSASQAFFQLYAVPKHYVEGMTAEFYAGNGGGYQAPAVPPEQREGQRFTADLRFGLAEDITLSVAFLYPDGTRQTQVLERFAGLYGQTFPKIRADYALGMKPVENGTFALTEQVRGQLDWDPSGTLPELSGDALPAAELESVRVGLFRNKKLVDWAVFSVTPGVVEEETEALTGEQWKALDSLRQNDGGGVRGYQLLTFQFAPQDVPAEAGDVFQIAAVLRDVYGRTAVRSGGAFGLDEGWGELAGLELDTLDTYPGGWMLEDDSSMYG